MEKKEGGTKSRTGTYGNGLALGSLSHAAKKEGTSAKPYIPTV